MQSSVISSRITSLYGSQTSSVVFACKTATFGPAYTSMGTRPDLSFCACKTAWLAPELLDSMGSSPHLWFCAFKPATFEQKLHVSMGPRRHLWFSACKPAHLASKLSVSRGPSPHLWFFHAKQRLLDPNNKSLWFSEITCRFVHAIQRD